MRKLIALALTASAVACSSESPTPLAGLAPDVMVTLTAAGPGGVNAAPTLAFSRSAAQVGLRLAGDLGEIDHLTAEVAPLSAPDDARRWRVDTAPSAADGAQGMVTLPAHALSTGDYVLTLWEGDARVVGRFSFRVAKDP
jgi:hypothetical protein